MSFTKKGRKKKYKTDTIKDRAIYVYLPSIEMAEKWKRLAKKAKVSISKFVVEHVENSLMQEDENFIPRSELLEEIKRLKEENAELRKRNKMLEMVIEKLEDELRIYRTKPFLEEYLGQREYERELIKIFKKGKEIRKDEILDLLGIDSTNIEAVKAINRQIENLERYGLIIDTGRGWKWKE